MDEIYEVKPAVEKRFSECNHSEVFENVYLMAKNGKLYVYNERSEVCPLADFIKNDQEFMDNMK